MRDVHGFVFDSRAQAPKSGLLQESACDYLYDQNMSPAGLEVAQWANELWHQRHPRRLDERAAVSASQSSPAIGAAG